MPTGFTIDTDFVPTVKPKLSPSHAHRWMNCAGSAWMAAVFKGGPSSISADEGTAAHGVLEALIRGNPLPTEVEVDYVTKKTYPTNPDMEEHGRRSLISLQGETAFITGAPLEAEQWLSYKYKGLDIRMRMDVSSGNDRIYVTVDYKYGTNPVDAMGNPQIGMYLVALRQLVGPRDLFMGGILQPRGSKGSYAIKWWTLTNAELDSIEANIQAAITRVLQTPIVYTVGPWCHWCPGLMACPAKSALMINVLLRRPPNNETPALKNLWVLEHASDAIATVKGVQEAVKERIMNGEKIHGWIVTSGKERRSWKDNIVPELEHRAIEAGLAISEVVTTPVVQPKGIGEVEKLGISTEGLTDKKPSKTKNLVRDDGKHEACETNADGFEEIQ